MDLNAIYLLVGILVIGSAWIPLFLISVPLSLPMLAVASGALAVILMPGKHPIGDLEPRLMSEVAKIAIVVSVLGAGLKIDRRFSFRGWASAWRLLGIAMLLSIVLTSAAAYWLLHASLGLAILLGASLAPTDPVLAADYTLGPPGTGEEGEAKFALTSDAGLNDGAAFPFVILGITLANEQIGGLGDLMHWAAFSLVWDLVSGAAIGTATGLTLVAVNSWLPKADRLSASNSGLVALGLGLVAFALAEMIHGNGFVAAFCEAVTIRNFSDVVNYSRRLDHAANQFERAGMVVVLMIFGASVANGLLSGVGWLEVAFALLVLLLVRPLCVAAGFLGSAEDRWTRVSLGYFGIRGIASLFYAAYAGHKIAQPDGSRVHAVIGLVVLASIVLYGTTAHAFGSWLRAQARSSRDET